MAGSAADSVAVSLGSSTASWLRTHGRRFVNRLGYDVTRMRPGTAFSRQRQNLLCARGVSLAVDVGASRGEYAIGLRDGGYHGTILSLEPLAASFESLAQHAENDPAWRALHVAAGPTEGVIELHVSGRDDCSSILQMDDRHRTAAPGSDYVSAQEVRLVRLDDLIDELGFGGTAAFLKLDVQGYELDVLRGASAFVRSVAVLETELSVVTLYREQPLFADVVTEIQRSGLSLVDLEPAFNDPETGEILQLNGLFARLKAPPENQTLATKPPRR